MNFNNDIFENLFVLDIAGNHRGNVERGLKIINDFSKIIKQNKVKAALKLQLRDANNFIHKDFINRTDIRYVKKAIDTKMSEKNNEILINAIKKNNCLTMATPFDEESVDFCEKTGIQILKIASCDINNHSLVKKIALTKKSVIISTGGTSLKDIDDIVSFFTDKNIPIALNHCVSIYPSEYYELDLNQIDFLKSRYSSLVIGFSTHEYNETIDKSMLMAYAKGARTFERHIDIDYEDVSILPYCSLPEDIDRWIKSYFIAKESCGSVATEKRISPSKEIEYLEEFARGVYAKRDLKQGEILSEKDFYLAIPHQKGQLSCRELIDEKILSKSCKKDAPIMADTL